MTRIVLALLAFLPLATAAGQAETAALPDRIGRPTRDTIHRLADSVKAAGLPAELLIAKAQEGALKQADDARILQAVRNLARRLAEARAALPRGAAAGTLVAAASALQAGIPVAVIARYASVASGAEADLAVAFVTLADLVASTVPPDAAASSVELLLRRRAREAEMAAFRAAVARDIQSGRTADAALSDRTRAAVQALGKGPALP
jgi:hypothetical protein